MGLPGCDIRGVQRRLLRRGVDTKQRHMYVCSAMEMFREFHRNCPVAERVSKEMLHLTINHHMKEEDARYIAESVLNSFLPSHSEFENIPAARELAFLPLLNVPSG